jgi:hypothetical protein
MLYGIVLFLNSKGIRLMKRHSSGYDFTTIVSMDAVALHAEPDDCWLAIAGHVYDLTHYVHPGGEAYILGRCGREATTAFDKEHTRHYLPMIEAFARGKLQENESATSAAGGDGGAGQQQQQGTAADDDDSTEKKKPTTPVNEAPVQAGTPLCRSLSFISVLSLSVLPFSYYVSNPPAARPTLMFLLLDMNLSHSPSSSARGPARALLHPSRRGAIARHARRLLLYSLR